MSEGARARQRAIAAARSLAVTTIGLGAVTAAVSAVLPWVGVRLLVGLRGREIVSARAQTILPELMLLGAAAGLGAAILLLSTGGLLRRAARGIGDGSPGVDAAHPPDGATASRRTVLLLLALAVAFGAAELVLAGRSLTYDEILAVEADVRTPWHRALAPRAGVNHISGSLLARCSR